MGQRAPTARVCRLIFKRERRTADAVAGSKAAATSVAASVSASGSTLSAGGLALRVEKTATGFRLCCAGPNGEQVVELAMAVKPTDGGSQ